MKQRQMWARNFLFYMTWMFAACCGMALFAVPGLARATITINTISLTAQDTPNSSDQVIYVTPGESFSAAVNVTISNYASANRWRSTKLTINGVETCINTGMTGAGYTANGSASQTLSGTAPAVAGSYSVAMTTYYNYTCSTSTATKTLSAAVVVAAAPTVSSIVRASSNPAGTNASVSWTVTFSKAVVGVDASDFSLVSSYGVSGASITSVSGSGTTWTVTANTGSGNRAGDLGLNLVNDGTITDANGRALSGTGTGEVYMVSPPCTQPANTPSGLTLTCVCDNFDRTALNPSSIFSSNWLATISSASDTTGIVPNITNQGYLRLTNNTTYNGKAATAPGAYPAAGNYISVEFRYYAYNGSNADGVAVTLSDYTVSPVPGSSGGSLGYAQKTGVNGFAGGWIGVGLDEYGNYQNPTEGRSGGPGARAQSVAVRGSGSGTTGYAWLGGTAANLSPLLSSASSTTPARGDLYQVIVDARGEYNTTKSTAVAVNRDTGNGYGSLVGIDNVYTASTTQSAVPANWQISFTGSTGASTNIHEIGAVRICASSIVPPNGGVASGFNAIDDAYPSVVQNFLNGHIYMKLMGTPFKLNVAALNNSQIQTNYVLSTNKNVTLKVVDNSDGMCVLDSSKSNYCSASCTGKSAVTGTNTSQTLTFTASDAGVKLSSDITVNTAYKNLVAIISDSSTAACSTDSFSVRPLSFQPAVVSATTAGQTVFKADSDPFTIAVTANGVSGVANGYTGVPKVNSAALTAVSPATVAGTIGGTFNAAVSGTPTATATGTSFKYTEVGTFSLPGYLPTSDTTSPRGVYEGVHATECGGSSCTTASKDALKAASWTGVDSISTKGDCVDENYSNTKDSSGSYATNTSYGKYGCLFGTTASTSFGRFIPDHFQMSNVLTNRSELSCSPTSAFTYMGEPMKATFTLTAQNGTGGTTKNYVGSVATLGLSDSATNRANMNLGAIDSYSASATRSIANITQANPGVVTTSSAHGYTTGDWVYINGVKGMTGVNNVAYQVTVVDSLRFSLSKSVNSVVTPVDTTSFTAYSSGGTAWVKSSTGTDLTARTQVDSLSGSWGTGTSAGIATGVQLAFRLNRRSDNVLDGPLMPEFGIAPVDADGVKISPYDLDIVTPTGNDHASLGLTQLLFGRIKLTNAHGSDRLNLPIPMRAEYWNSSAGAFVTNTLDNCTTFSCANFTLTNYRGGINASNEPTDNLVLGSTCTASTTMSAGAAKLTLLKPKAKPSSKGSVDVCLDLASSDANYTCTATTTAAMPWLQGRWTGKATYVDDPKARATFGVYRSEYIYLRELY